MRKVPKVLIIISIIVLVFLSYQVIEAFENNSHTPIEFTSERWNKDIEQRYRMLDSLFSKYSFASMSYNQIVELLGTNGIAEDSGKNKITYYTGKAIYYGNVKINQPFFSIGFDGNGRVISTTVGGPAN